MTNNQQHKIHVYTLFIVTGLIYGQYQFKLIVVLASIEVVLIRRCLRQFSLLCYHVFVQLVVEYVSVVLRGACYTAILWILSYSFTSYYDFLS